MSSAIAVVAGSVAASSLLQAGSPMAMAMASVSNRSVAAFMAMSPLDGVRVGSMPAASAPGCAYRFDLDQVPPCHVARQAPA